MGSGLRRGEITVSTSKRFLRICRNGWREFSYQVGEAIDCQKIQLLVAHDGVSEKNRISSQQLDFSCGIVINLRVPFPHDTNGEVTCLIELAAVLP